MSIINNPLLLGGSGGSGGGGGGGSGGGGGGGTPAPEAWAAKLTTGGSGGDSTAGIALDAAGNPHVAGMLLPGGIFVAKYNPQGVLQWQRRHSTSGWANGCVVDAQGNVYTAGSIQTSYQNVYVVKYNSSGTFQWEFRIGVTGQNCSGEGIAIDSTGAVYVISTATQNLVAYLVKVGSDGTLAWQRVVASAPTEGASGIAIDKSDNIFVLSTKYDGVHLYKYNTSGVIQWKRSLANAQGAKDVAVDTAGNIYCALTEAGPVGVIVKLDAAGAILWQRRLTGSTGVTGLGVDADGNVYASLSTSGSHLVKLDSAGNVLGAKMFTGVESAQHIVPSGSHYYLAANIGGWAADMGLLKLPTDFTDYKPWGPYTSEQSPEAKRMQPTVQEAAVTTTITSTSVAATDGAGTLMVGAGTGFTSTDPSATAQTIQLVPLDLANSADVDSVFSTHVYTGTGSASQVLSTGIDYKRGGMVWIKSRSSGSHYLTDTMRGAGKPLLTNLNVGQADYNHVAGFTNGAFAVGSNANASSTSFVSWSFRKAPKFFDVVTYTGTGANRTIAHNLGSVPGCIIVKRTDTTGDWQVYHRSLANTEYLMLNTTAAKATGTTRWNSATPTSTEFSLGTDATVNASGGTYVAYLFAHDAGGFGDSGNDSVVKCGSFTHNGSTDQEIDLGWEAQWVLLKSSSVATDWYMVDTMRGAPVGQGAQHLTANSSGAEVAMALVYPSAKGFVMRSGAFTDGSTHVYIAIRRGLMVKPTDATKVFNAVQRGGTSANATVECGFQADAFACKGLNYTSGCPHVVVPRLAGGRFLDFSSFAVERAQSSTVLQPNPWDVMNGIKIGTNGTETNRSGVQYVNYFFRRAPSFFDVVAYTGTGSARTVSHNLGVAPELMLIKRRDTTSDWQAYSASLSNTEYLAVNTTAAKATGATRWNSTTPTSSVFSLGTDAAVNASAGTYVAYLFASLTGVSKVGKYTGTGTTLNVDCGFTNGARFVLIKCTDSEGDWHVWDTARGIISGNDPYILLNSGEAQSGSKDYIDPLSSGFQISSPAPINANGGTYIYLAIA